MSGKSLLAERAAELREVAGVEVAAHFGAPAAEYAAARASYGLMHRPRRTLVNVGGGDRIKFLHGLLSNDLEHRESGEGCRALFLDVKGHVRADLDVWSAADAVIIGCDTAFVERDLDDLRKYVLGADVVIDDRSDRDTVLAVVGPRADELLRAAGLEPPSGDRAHVSATLAGIKVRIARSPGLGAPGAELHVPADAAEAAWQALESACSPPPAYLGWDTAEVLRIEAGWPATDCEITGEEFPQEARMDDAIDYEKGCYLGQETVARIHYRGQVNRLLAGLAFARPVEPGAELVSGERVVGRVTSTGASPAFGPVGLGYVRREQAVDGESLQARGSDGPPGAATVRALPFTE